MNAILSIKPHYAHSILSGKKKVEFRKAKFKNEVKKIYIYSSAPDKRIIGYSILIDKVFKFKNPIEVFTNFTPPQSFCYCGDIRG